MKLKYLAWIFVFLFLVSSINVLGTISTTGNLSHVISGGTNYTTYIFNTSGIFNTTENITMCVLVVAGGGAGGIGGGGAGGILYNCSYIVPSGSYNVTVGRGGNNGATISYYGGANGTFSKFHTLNATGGGGGGGGSGNNGSIGGSGGGSGSGSALYRGGYGISGQGYMGGNTTILDNTGAGGGGGAGRVGYSATVTNIGGNGGSGLNYTISGTNTNYSCGGGGGVYTAGLTAGNGGCASAGSGYGGNATKNSGSGGSGNANSPSSYIGGSGADGVIIISIANVNTYNIILNPPSESGTTKYLPDNYLLVNASINGNLTTYRNMTLNVYNSTGLIYSNTTSLNSTFLNLTLPMINDTYYYNITTRNTTGGETYSSTYTNYIRYAVLNVTAFNLSGSVISSFNISVNGVNYTTTSSYILADVIIGSTYDIVWDTVNYAYAYATRTITSSLTKANATLYPEGYISIYTYSELDGSLITSVTNFSVVNAFNSYSLITAGGSVNKTNATPGIYTVTSSNPFYSPTQYVIDLGVKSYVLLNVYLKNGTAILFNYRDYGSSTIEGVSLKVYRYVNGSLTLTGSYLSDVTGKVQFYALQNTFYAFNNSKDGYASYYFTLNPILFTSYDVPMSTLTSGTTTPTGYMFYSPSSFYENQLVNFRNTFTSPYSSFVSYQYTFSYPGGSVSHSGINPGGEVFNDTFRLDDTSSHIATLTYSWILSNGASQSDTINFLIIAPWQNKTMMNMGEKHYGMLLGDSVVLLTLILVVVMGVAYLAVGLVGSFLFGGIIIIIMLSNGFIPLEVSPLYYLFGFVAIIVIALRGLSSGGVK